MRARGKNVEMSAEFETAWISQLIPRDAGSIGHLDRTQEVGGSSPPSSISV